VISRYRQPGEENGATISSIAFRRLHFTKLLSERDDIEIIGKAENGRQAMALPEKETIDPAFMDIDIPELTRIEARRGGNRKKETSRFPMSYQSPHTHIIAQPRLISEPSTISLNRFPARGLMRHQKKSGYTGIPVR
jgi:hypothetical protein